MTTAYWKPRPLGRGASFTNMLLAMHFIKRDYSIDIGSLMKR